MGEIIRSPSINDIPCHLDIGFTRVCDVFLPRCLTALSVLVTTAFHANIRLPIEAIITSSRSISRETRSWSRSWGERTLEAAKVRICSNVNESHSLIDPPLLEAKSKITDERTSQTGPALTFQWLEWGHPWQWHSMHRLHAQAIACRIVVLLCPCAQLQS